MELNEIIKVEIKPLCSTILEYTTDIYISSYARQLQEINFDLERSKFFMLIDRLHSWYLIEIKKIIESEYCHNKNTHMKSQKIVEFLYNSKDLKNEDK